MRHCKKCKKDKKSTEFKAYDKVCIVCKKKYYSHNSMNLIPEVSRKCLKCDQIKMMPSNHRLCDSCNYENSQLGV